MKSRPFWRSLGGRIVMVFVALLLAVQGVSLLLTRLGIERSAREQIDVRLSHGEALLREQLSQRGELLQAGAATVGADYGLLSTLQGEVDADTVRSTLEDKLGRLRPARLAAVLDRQGRLLAAVGPQAAALAQQAARHDDGRWQEARLVRLGDLPCQVVKVPIGQRGEAPSGWLLAAVPLADLLPELARLAQAELSLIGPQQVLASTLSPARGTAALAPLLQAGPAAQELTLAGDALEVRRVELPALGEAGVPLVLSLSIDEAVRPYEGLQGSLLLVSGLGLGLFALGSLLTARRLTAPMQGLVDATRRLGRGDYATPVATVASQDEMAELAQAFEGMRQGIAERTEHIRQLAFWDTLTGLPNRSQFEDEAARLVSGEAGAALLMLNIDRLERVNQVLGRAAGDQVLRQVAQRLRALALDLPERQPLVARLGGDEFALLLPGADLGRAREVARLVQRQLTEQALVLDGSTVDLSAGVGIAVAPLHANDTEALLARALLALTECKRRTAGMLAYDPSIDAGSAQTLSLLGELRQAIRGQELRLYLQPKLRLADDQVLAAEALVRWQHPQRGLVPPVQFIPFAEETGFIHELTLWVVDEAARQAALLRAQGLAPRISVNLSAHDLMKPELQQRLRTALQRHGAEPGWLCLEITESAIAHDPQRALQTLHALKAEGFRLSIDDFGAGQTSLAQLIDLPVDELKLDMLFVRTMDQDADKASMVGALVRMGHDLRLSVVAEGVENAAILQRLRALGCDEAQGWHIGKPMPAEELPSWLQARALLASVQRA
ncbi:EAL domain-containing protein [Ideonella sp. 4Y11]|uniref:EAL domain-containing protein n=1 Tax=Ideonella aquatica TaxID=2824119 RepID=A0A940YN79_9BURK|nr:EAL domain-containing protein [Ideonella aquatica]MBQ0960996.1 EAL domain-containing protein [Ideonella aquatica]